MLFLHCMLENVSGLFSRKGGQLKLRVAAAPAHRDSRSTPENVHVRFCLMLIYYSNPDKVFGQSMQVQQCRSRRSERSPRDR